MSGNAPVRTFPRSHVLRVGGRPRSEFLLIPFGRVEVDRAYSGADFDFTRRHAEQALKWFTGLARKLAIDYEHQSLGELNTRADGLVPAAGWIGELVVRPDGLWAARVEWTDMAAGLLARGEYAYMSPVIFWSDDKQTDLTALGPVALTNDPATKGAEPLVAGKKSPADSRRHSQSPAGRRCHTSQSAILSAPTYLIEDVLQQRQQASPASPGATQGGPGMDRLRELLGLSADTPEAEVIAAAVAALEAAGGGGKTGGEGGGGGTGHGGGSTSADARAAGRDEALATIAKRLELGEVASVDALVAAIGKLSAGESDGAVTVLQKQVKDLSTAVEGLRAQNAALVEANQRAEFEAVLASGEHAFKIDPASADKFFALYQTNRETFDAVLAAIPAKVHQRTVFRGGPAAAATSVGQTAAEWKAAFKKDARLQAEFGSEDTYVAYMKAEQAGQVNVLKSSH